MFLTRLTTLPFLLLLLSPFVIFDTDYALISSLLCKSNTLWNILMILGSNEEQDQTTCEIQESPLLVFEFDFLSLLCDMNTLLKFDDAWYKCRIGGDDVLHTRMTTLEGLGWGDICFF